MKYIEPKAWKVVSADCFANSNGEMHCMLPHVPISPTTMAKCTACCHVDEFANRADKMLTKIDPLHIMYQNELLLENSL